MDTTNDNYKISHTGRFHCPAVEWHPGTRRNLVPRDDPAPRAQVTYPMTAQAPHIFAVLRVVDFLPKVLSS